MKQEKTMVAFGTQFRGYRKEDVNQYIETQSRKYTKACAEAEERNKQQTDTIYALQDENKRLSTALSESDQIIVRQKKQIDELEKAREQLLHTFSELKTEVETLEKQISEHISGANQNEAAHGQVRDKAREPITDASSVATHEKEKKPDHQDEKEQSFSGALKIIKNKILKFIK